MTTTPAHPQPAPTPLTDAFVAAPMSGTVGQFVSADFARSLERRLAERDAEAAKLNERMQAITDAAKVEADQLRTSLRAAEERAGKAEQLAADRLSWGNDVHRQFVQETGRVSDLNARLSAVAEEIAATGAVEALKSANISLHYWQSHADASNVAVGETRAIMANVYAALEAFTALLAKLREGRA